MATEFFIPKMTEHMDSARIVRWLVNEGDYVTKGQIILEVETEKAVTEVESPIDGFIKGIREGLGEGCEVNVGEIIAFIVAEGEETPTLPPLTIKKEEISTRRVTTQVDQTHKVYENQPIRATPAARRLSKEARIDLNQVIGKGEGGVIREEDVREYLQNNKAMKQDDWLDLSPIQKLTGQRMLESIKTIPQFSASIDIDFSKLMEFKENTKIQEKTTNKPSITAILVFVISHIIINFPQINSVFDNNRIHHYHDINIGVAVGTESGLFVPVIKNADKKPLLKIGEELSNFQAKAQNGRFTESDLSGGTFTISNLGMYGITQFNAIIYPTQCAILAVGCIHDRFIGKSKKGLEIRPFARFTLTSDHRVIDGLFAAKFLNSIKDNIEQDQFYNNELIN